MNKAASAAVRRPAGTVCELSLSWPVWGEGMLGTGRTVLRSGPYAFAVLPRHAVFTPTPDRKAIAQFDWTGKLVRTWRPHASNDTFSDVIVSGRTLVAGSWNAPRLHCFDLTTGKDRVVDLEKRQNEADGNAADPAVSAPEITATGADAPQESNTATVIRLSFDKRHFINAVFRHGTGFAQTIVSPDLTNIQVSADDFPNGGIPEPAGKLTYEKLMEAEIEPGQYNVYSEIHSYARGHDTVLDLMLPAPPAGSVVLAELIGYSSDKCLYFTCLHLADSRHPWSLGLYQLKIGQPRHKLANLGQPLTLESYRQGNPRRYVVTPNDQVYALVADHKPTSKKDTCRFRLVSIFAGSK